MVETPSGLCEAREDLLHVPVEYLAEREAAEELRRQESVRAAEYNATVVSLDLAHSDLAIFRVAPDSGTAQYEPGQYTTLGLCGFERRVEDTQAEEPPPPSDTLIRRAYSMSHRILGEDGEVEDCGSDPFYEFYIVLVRDNGEGNPAPGLTPRLFGLEKGSRVAIGKKATGHYTLHHLSPETNTVVLGGTGTGEAPHMPMIARLLATGFQGDIVCLEVSRYSRDFGYAETHERVMAKHQNYRYISLSTRDPDVKEKVYIQDYISKGMLRDLLGYEPDPATTHWYFCGNPKMLGVPVTDKETGAESYPSPTGVIEILEGMGHRADRGAKNPGNIHYEEYW
ncbi:ferredoxin--NADP reductase [bacterium]|nr:ferredoxin--NADP reductase [bacterium]